MQEEAVYNTIKRICTFRQKISFSRGCHTSATSTQVYRPHQRRYGTVHELRAESVRARYC